MQPSSNRERSGTRPQARTSDGDAAASDALLGRLSIRNLDGGADAALAAWVHARLARQLAKYIERIERIDVRFGDENGPKGGIDRCCMVHVVLGALPPIVVEMRGGSDREAFDLAANRAERATQRSLQKHGFSAKHRRRRDARDEEALQPEPDSAARPHEPPRDANRLAQLHAAHTRLSRPSDAALEAGTAEHTATRNVKHDAAGMAYALEDSSTGRPSRKSTRSGANHIKPGNGLTLRKKSALHNPQHTARRG